MSQDWAVVVAALGSSAFTGLVSFGIVFLQHQLTKRAATKKSKIVAYASLLASSQKFIIRSINLPKNTEMDPKEKYDWISDNLEDLIDVIAMIWLEGTQEAITLANKLSEIPNNIQIAETKDDKEKFIEQFIKTRVAFANLARKELGSGAVPFVDNSHIENQTENSPTTNPITPKSNQVSNGNQHWRKKK